MLTLVSRWLQSASRFKKKKGRGAKSQTRIHLEQLEERLALTGTYVSPFTISGLNPAYISDLGTLTGSGRINEAETTTTPVYSASGTNPWYQLSNYYPQTTGPEAQGSDWGPQPLLLPQPALPTGVAPNTFGSITCYEQRVVAAAEAFIGTPYQHHHDALWNPYPDQPSWPWNSVSTNQTSTVPVPRQLPNGSWQLTFPTFPNPYYSTSPPGYNQPEAGIDCSDLAAAVYNAAAGIYINSAVGEQGLINANGTYVGSSPIGWNSSSSPLFVNPNQQTNANLTPITPQFIRGPNFAYSASSNTDYISTWNTPGSLTSFINQLLPGDLLYIANNAGPTPPTLKFASVSTNGSADLTLTSSQAAQVSANMTVTGPGIGAGTTIKQIIGSTVILSSPAGTGAGSGTFSFIPGTNAVTHVAIYLGKYATLNGQEIPLVISSHDNTPAVLANPNLPGGPTNMPPPGVQILPLDPQSWFYQNLSFAMRLLPTFQLSSSITESVPARALAPTKFFALFSMAPECQNAPVATGTVTLTCGSSTLGTIVLPASSSTCYAACFPLAGISPGYHTLTITYSGDTNYPSIVQTCCLFVSVGGFIR